MMHKTFTILSLLLLFSFTRATADIIIQTTEVTYTPGTEFTIPFIIYGASEEGTPISSVYIVMTYDTAALQYMQFLNFNPLMPQNQWFYNGNNNLGLVAANWSHPLIETVALPDGSNLFEVKFKAKPGASPLTFITYEFLDAEFNVIPTTPDHGSYASIQQVSFQVDMRDQAVSPDGVHLAGSFNGWSTTATPLVNDSVAKYSVTLALICDSAYSYRFVNGNTTGGYEMVPAECGTPSGSDYNRTINIPAGDTALPQVCFSSCTLCPPLADVTFQVDMRDQDIGAGGVHLAGSFNGWSPSATPMTLLSSTTYTVTLQLIADSAYIYKFINGNTNGGYETVPAECGVLYQGGYVRSVDVTLMDTLVPEVCFSSCTLCPPLADVTFQVDMRDQDIGAEGVHLAGSFNGWSPSATPMTLLSSTTYAVTLPLIADSAYTYKFINGNTNGGSETVPAECGVLYQGGYVRSVDVPLMDILVPEVCFSSCDTCPPLTQVSFRVDMSQQSISPNGVHIAGTFNGWNPAAALMNNLGSDIFGVTLPLIVGSDAEYRFVNGNTAEGYEIVPSNCGVPAGGGLYNRHIEVPGSDTTLMAVCFSNCDECLTIRTVTFKVDMSQENVSPNGVHLAGSFNGFNPNSIPMTNQGNDVYFVTVDLLQNELITYRFVNGNNASGFETVPPECGMDDGNGTYNRYFTVPGNDTILGEVCFSSCEDCYLEPWQKNVTFQVDMSNEIISENGVYLAGTFNGWDPAANQMLHLGNNIYFITLILNENDIHQYRFVNGNTISDYEIIPEECGYSGTSGGLERQIIIPSVDTTLDMVCFSSCSTCVIFDVTLRIDMMREIVNVNGVHVAGSFNNWDPASFELSSSGSSVYEVTLEVYAGDTLFYRFVNGDQADVMEIIPMDCGWLYNGQDFSRYLIPSSDTIMEEICFSWCDLCDVSVSDLQELPQNGNIYPNPADQFIKIPLRTPVPVKVILVLGNVTGNTFKTETLSLAAGNHELTLPVHQLPPGLYFLKLQMDGTGFSSNSTQKLLINR